MEKLPNGDMEEELKRQSIDKVDYFRISHKVKDLFSQVDDLLAMLDREGGDSPSPEDDIEGGLSIDEVGTSLRESKNAFAKSFRCPIQYTSDFYLSS